MKYKDYSFLAEKKRRRNCFLLGIVSGAILLLITMELLNYVIWYTKRKVNPSKCGRKGN